MKLSIFCVLAGGFLASVSRAELSARKVSLPPLDPAVCDLIAQLGDSSFAKRMAASKRLDEMTVDGLRPLLVEAVHHWPDPEIRQRAADLLCNLSWTLPEDSEPVRRALRGYRSPNPQRRMEALAQLSTLGNSAAPTLIRLLVEDPSDEVRWGILAQLRTLDATTRSRLRQLQPEPDDAVLLAAAGWGWQTDEPERAAPFFRRAVDVAATQPADDHGEVHILLLMLQTRAINRAEYADATALYRRQIWYSELPAEQEALNLLALHAQFGRQPGFEGDVRMFAPYFDQPEMMYIMGHLQERQGMPLLADAMYLAGLARNMNNADGHLQVGEFLIGQKWFGQAERELRASLAGEGSGAGLRSYLAYVNLSHCAENRCNEREAAEDLDNAVKILNTLPRSDEIAQAEFAGVCNADWHRLRDASEKQNHAEMGRLVNKLLAARAARPNPGGDLDVDIDLVRALKALGRAGEARQVFKEAYPILRAQLNQQPHDANALNNLAWLCARSGENPEEAYRLSSEAIHYAPASSAYLDTAAESAAQMGKWNEAVQHETTALRFDPGDAFMTRQLERFVSEAAKQK